MSCLWSTLGKVYYQHQLQEMIDLQLLVHLLNVSMNDALHIRFVRY